MINFQLITPERIVFSQDIYEATIPTQNGEISVLPNHLPLISLLKPGIISLRENKGDSDSKLEHVAVMGGFIEVGENSIKVMADSAEKASEVNEIEAQNARKRAEELKEKATDEISLADATAALEHSLIRLKLADLKKRRHSS